MMTFTVTPWIWYWWWFPSQDTLTHLPWRGTLPEEMDFTAWDPCLSTPSYIPNISTLKVLSYTTHLILHTTRILRKLVGFKNDPAPPSDFKMNLSRLLTSWFSAFPRHLSNFAAFPGLLPFWCITHSLISISWQCTDTIFLTYTHESYFSSFHVPTHPSCQKHSSPAWRHQSFFSSKFVFGFLEKYWELGGKEYIEQRSRLGRRRGKKLDLGEKRLRSGEKI